MPKISAPTVGEHRAAQRAAILKATGEILVASGLEQVTPRAVAERAGLARSSVYEYFASRDDALAAVAVDAFSEWEAELSHALSKPTPTDRLRAVVETTLRLTADGKHDIAAILQRARLSPSREEDIMLLHDKLLAPLDSLLRDLDVPDLEIHRSLLRGLLNSGMELVNGGRSVSEVAARMTALLERGLLPAMD